MKTEDLQQFLYGLEQPNSSFFSAAIDVKQIYHLDEVDGIHGRTTAVVTSPEITSYAQIFGPDVTAVSFLLTCLIEIVIDKEESTFGKIRVEDEADCFDWGTDFPIHAKLKLVDGSEVEKTISELIGGDETDFNAIEDILRKYMPYSVMVERIQAVDLKPQLTDKVISKILWAHP